METNTYSREPEIAHFVAVFDPYVAQTHHQVDVQSLKSLFSAMTTTSRSLPNGAICWLLVTHADLRDLCAGNGERDVNARCNALEKHSQVEPDTYSSESP
jgi:hypothetical protein